MSAPAPAAKIVWTTGEHNGRTFWTRVGTAVAAPDGTLHVTLKLVPVTGTLIIRDPVPGDPEG